MQLEDDVTVTDQTGKYGTVFHSSLTEQSRENTESLSVLNDVPRAISGKPRKYDLMT